MNNLWTPELAERTAVEACAARDLFPPSDFVRFSEAAVFRSGDVAVRVDQGHTDRLTGDRARQMVDYMGSVGLRTIETAGIETFVAHSGLNVTFYKFMSEGDDSQWEVLLRGFGEQVRHIHNFAELGQVRTIAPPAMQLSYADRKLNAVVDRLCEFRDNLNASCLTSDQVAFLLGRAETLRLVLGGVGANEKTGALSGVAPLESDVVVHGDAHLGNATMIGGKVHVYDFEEVGFGAPFLDHLHMLLADRLFNIPQAYEHFAAGYGKDFSDAPFLDEWLEVMAFIYVLWSAGLGVVSEKHRFETLERFRFWEEGFHSQGISSINKDDLPYLWNAHI